MVDGSRLAHLVQSILPGASMDSALDKLAQGALELTSSRHAIIAMMNDELGALEVLHGAGDSFSAIGKLETLKVAIEAEEGIVSYVAATGKPFESGNVRGDPRYKKLFETTVSELAVPVRDQFGRIRAVLNIESDVENAYEAADKDACLAIASLVAVVLEMHEREVREEALVEIGSALKRALTEEALVDQVTHVASEVLRFQAASVFLLERSTGQFVLQGSTSHLKTQVGHLRYSPGEGCTGWVCETGQPILLTNPQEDPRWRGRYLEFPGEQIASFLCVPILIRGQAVGAIRVLRRNTENPYLDNRFTENDLSLLQAISEQVAYGLENIRNVDRMLRSERMIAWGELSAKSSHMIGNRVFAVKGDINELDHLLNENPISPPKLASIQRSLAKNVLRVEEILQDFRDFVSATQLHRVLGNINELIRETVDEIFPRRSGIELDLQLIENLPEVNYDAKKLRRALSELLENALNYMDPSVKGSRLRISSSMFQEDLHVASHPYRQTMVQIEIEDTGPGIEEAQKSIIFQPFYSNRVKGMGLGLSIVKGIIDAHGGEVFEAGESGAGARFVILLPSSERP